MLLIIDGYNVLKQVIADRDISVRERTRFLAMLNRYANIKKHMIAVVFDGGPYDYPTREVVHGITVLYSGARETADECITYVLEYNKKRDLLLVSSDRELAEFAAKQGVPSIDAIDFYHLLLQAIQPKQEVHSMETQVVKTAEASAIELDRLMEEASEDIVTKQEDIIYTMMPETDKKKLSRIERKLFEKLKKL